MASNLPLHVFTNDLIRCGQLSRLTEVLLAIVELPRAPRAPFTIPFYMDYGNIALWVDGSSACDFDVAELLEQVIADKFKAVYLLDGHQDVMLFRNKYCGGLSPHAVFTASIEELQSLKWAGVKENIGAMTLKKVEA